MTSIGTVIGVLMATVLVVSIVILGGAVVLGLVSIFYKVAVGLWRSLVG